MKWSIFVCLLVCLARHCSAWVLRCPPGITECTKEKKENIDAKETLSKNSHAGATTECLAGTEWDSKCHFCRCSDTGIAECLKTEHCEPEIYEEPYLCKPNTTFLRDCNRCLCLDNGMALCSVDYCFDKPQEINIEESDKTVSTHRSTDKDLVAPVQTTKSAVNQTKAVVCEANRMFMKDCNTCWCNEHGTSYFCTRRICLPLLPEEEADLGGIPAEDLIQTKKACRPNEVFEVDCNMCRCNPDGKSYSCTRKTCTEQLKDNKNVTLSRKVRGVSTELTKTCQPGQEFRLDCNNCLCDNEGHDFSCTRIDCNAENSHASALTAPRIKRDTTDKVPMTCAPGSVFNRECNLCRCTQDGGFALCTLKNCTKENKADRLSEWETGFRCNPGEQFKRDCNDCTCSADGRSIFCTLRLCDQDLTLDI